MCCEYFRSVDKIGHGTNSDMSSVPISRSYVKKLSNTEKSRPKCVLVHKQQGPQGEDSGLHDRSISENGKNGLSLTDYTVSVAKEASATRVDVGINDKNTDNLGQKFGPCMDKK